MQLICDHEWRNVAREREMKNLFVNETISCVCDHCWYLISHPTRPTRSVDFPLLNSSSLMSWHNRWFPGTLWIRSNDNKSEKSSDNCVTWDKSTIEEKNLTGTNRWMWRKGRQSRYKTSFSVIEQRELSHLWSSERSVPEWWRWILTRLSRRMTFIFIVNSLTVFNTVECWSSLLKLEIVLICSGSAICL